jgi:hypothetical protein
MKRLIILLAVTALASACASQSKPVQLTKIQDDTRVLLKVEQAESKLPDASSDGGTYAANVGAGALAGAGMGAVAGFTMGFACGPAVVICGPIGALGGAMGGTVFGIGVGTFSAASLQLPQKKAERLDEIIAATFQELDMGEEVAMSFRDTSATRWTFVDDGEQVQVGIVLEGIGLQKHKKDQVTISMVTTLLVQTGTGDDAKVEKKKFSTTSPSRHIDYWIGEDGENFREELRVQMSRHATEMVVALSAPATYPGKYQMPEGAPTKQAEIEELGTMASR